jgi:hypothetical protein
LRTGAGTWPGLRYDASYVISAYRQRILAGLTCR